MGLADADSPRSPAHWFGIAETTFCARIADSEILSKHEADAVSHNSLIFRTSHI